MSDCYTVMACKSARKTRAAALAGLDSQDWYSACWGLAVAVVHKSVGHSPIYWTECWDKVPGVDLPMLWPRVWWATAAAEVETRSILPLSKAGLDSVDIADVSVRGPQERDDRLNHRIRLFGQSGIHSDRIRCRPQQHATMARVVEFARSEHRQTG